MRSVFLAATLLLFTPFVFAAEQLAQADGLSVELPATWEARKGLMGALLTARPPRSDAAGWGSDLLVITAEPYNARRSCLDGFVLRKLRDMGHLATGLQVLDEHAWQAGPHEATRLELDYSEGPRHLHAYVAVIATPKRMITATLTADPARFEFQRARFRRLIESLRAQR